MAYSYADVDDVADLTAAATVDPVKTARLIERASAMVRAHVGAPLDASPPSTVLLDVARSVVAAMVARALTNPDGIRQEAMGSYSYSLAEPVPGLRILPGEVEALNAASARRRRRVGMFTVSHAAEEFPLAGDLLYDEEATA